MRIDDGGHRVRGVMESVDELEAERDQQRDAEQQERHPRRRGRVRGLDVRLQAVGHVEHAETYQCQEENRSYRTDLDVEVRTARLSEDRSACAHGSPCYVCDT